MKILVDGIEITRVDWIALKNDLLEPEQWLKAALVGKINNCTKRMDNAWRPILDADPTVASIPASQTERIQLIHTRTDYKDRMAREAEIEAAKR